MEVDHHANILKVAAIMKEFADGFLTDIGFKLLENQVAADLELLKEGLSQKPLCRICCYMCVAFNLICYFQGYVLSLDEPSDDLKNLGLETLSIAQFFEEQLPAFQKNLTDKYAHIFYDVKVQSFKREIFGNVHHIPVNQDMLPEGFDPELLKKN
jgi:hypothetical protein